MNDIELIVETIKTHAEHTESEEIKSYIVDTLLPFLEELNNNK